MIEFNLLLDAHGCPVSFRTRFVPVLAIDDLLLLHAHLAPLGLTRGLAGPAHLGPRYSFGTVGVRLLDETADAAEPVRRHAVRRLVQVVPRRVSLAQRLAYGVARRVVDADDPLARLV